MSGKQRKLGILGKINSGFGIKGEMKIERRAWINVKSKHLVNVCRFLRDEGFAHLSAISATDLLKKGKFEILYHLWSYKDRMLLTVKTGVGRKKPAIESVVPVWEAAGIHERELHEFFGINFRGNPDLSELFLEGWEELPPFRKDFDRGGYLKKEYDSENERDRVYLEDEK